MTLMKNCTVCGESFSDDIRFLNHMMESMVLEIPILVNLIEIAEVTDSINFVNNLELTLHQNQ